MSENIALNAVLPQEIDESSSPVNSTVDDSRTLEQYEQKFVQLRREINQFKNGLRSKYEQLEVLRENIAEQKQARAQINPRARKLNRLQLNLPNFLIIGTQKGGTTWLHENLKRHPQIFLPEGKKELEFFSYYQKKIADTGLSDYLKSFNQFADVLQSSKPIAIGEATPSYFWSTSPARKWTKAPKYFNDQIPGTVANLLGTKVKLILCLRDPVARAISAYFHHIKRDRISYKTQSILDVGHLYGIVDMGFYSQHLEAWLQHFSIENFQVLLYERDIKQNKQQTIAQICDFLGVDNSLFPTATNLNQYHNRGLRYRIQEDGVWLIDPKSEQETLVIKASELKQLRQIYRADCFSLQKTLGIDLNSYWHFEE